MLYLVFLFYSFNAVVTSTLRLQIEIRVLTVCGSLKHFSFAISSKITVLSCTPQCVTSVKCTLSPSILLPAYIQLRVGLGLPEFTISPRSGPPENPLLVDLVAVQPFPYQHSTVCLAIYCFQFKLITFQFV